MKKRVDLSINHKDQKNVELYIRPKCYVENGGQIKIFSGVFLTYTKTKMKSLT